MSTLSDLVAAAHRLLDDLATEIEKALTESHAVEPTPPPVLDVVASPSDASGTMAPDASSSTPTFAESLAAEAPAPAPDVVPSPTDSTSPDASVSAPVESVGPPQTHAEALAEDAALAAARASQAPLDTPTA